MNDDLHSLAAAYSIDALDHLERRRFESHLEQCASCAVEVAEFQETASALPGPDVQPSAGLRSSTLALIAQTPQVDAGAETPQVDAGAETPQVDAGAESPQVDAGAQSPQADASNRAHGSGNSAASVTRGGGWGAQQWVLSAAAVLLVVAALAAVVVVANRTSGNDATDEIAAVIEAPDAIRFSMRADDPARASTELEVVHSAGHDATVVVGDHVHGTEAGQTYQLWGVTPDGPVDAGLFEPTADGTVEAPVGTPQGVEGWAVTVEPEGGSEVPTGDPVFTSPEI